MKRVKHTTLEDGTRVTLYEAICDLGNVIKAVETVARGSRDDLAKKMRLDPTPYALEAQRLLVARQYRYTGFIQKDIVERGKKRHICYTRSFPDGVIQHAAFQVLGPVLQKGCVCSYAAQEGRGIHLCSMKLRKAMVKYGGGGYFLKCDVKRYFDSIDRDVLFGKLKRRIKDRDSLDYLHEAIHGAPQERGVPIGLYSSQILATFFLSDVCHGLKEKEGVRDLFVYMDDFVMLSTSKRLLHGMRGRLEDMLKRIGLRMKGNWCVRPLRTGIDFVGFVHFHDHVRIRRRDKLAFIRSCGAVERAVRHGGRVTPLMLRSLQSRASMLGWADCRRLRSVHGGRAEYALAAGARAGDPPVIRSRALPPRMIYDIGPKALAETRCASGHAVLAVVCAVPAAPEGCVWTAVVGDSEGYDPTEAELPSSGSLTLEVPAPASYDVRVELRDGATVVRSTSTARVEAAEKGVALACPRYDPVTVSEDEPGDAVGCEGDIWVVVRGDGRHRSQ